MKHTRHFLTYGLVLGSLILVGAACSKAPTTTNTNTSAVTNTTTTTNQDVNADNSFSTNSTPEGNGQTVTLTVSASGVDESRVTVTSGTTVQFHNTDSVSHQISSDPHPSHSDLPAFDRLIVPGGVYNFTFTQTGTFGYHDHLRAADTKYQGSVTVQ